jgi:hypothetical protein
MSERRAMQLTRRLAVITDRNVSLDSAEGQHAGHTLSCRGPGAARCSGQEALSLSHRSLIRPPWGLPAQPVPMEA